MPWVAALFVLLALGSVFAWLAAPPLVRGWRRRRVAHRPFPSAWREILRRRMPAFQRLPVDLQLALKRRVLVLLAEVPVIGCDGLKVTDEMRVLVAAQAALLLMARRNGDFGALHRVLLYPAPFVVDRSAGDATGVVHETRRALSGESWGIGQVILSWPDVLAGAADPGDGHNVVIHEFAHQLDSARGRQANGAPWLGERRAYVRWAAVLSAEFEALRARLARGEPAGVLDPYAATDPAEFFAVASEHFFEQPHALAAAHPALFGELARCYRVDPLAW